jgi:phosphatidate cytidylyltransferase
VSDWRDDHEPDLFDFDDEQDSAPTRASGEGVRILGPDEREGGRRGRAADDSDEFWGESPSDFDLPEDGDETWSASSEGLADSQPRRRRRGRRGRRSARRGSAQASAPEEDATPETVPPEDASGPVRLPHWTEPPTGEVPRVVSGPQERVSDADDDLDAWPTSSGHTPRYRMEASDWAEADFSDPDVLRDDSAALGALREHDEIDEDDDAAFEEEVAARRRGAAAAARRRPERGERPERRGALEAEEAAPAEPDHAPPDLVTRVLTAVAIAVVALIMLRLGRVPATFMVAVIVGAAAFELYEAFRRAGYHPATVLGLLGCISIVPIAYSNGVEAFPLVIVLVTAFTLLWYMAEVVSARPIVNIAITLFTFVYIGVFGAFAGLLLSAPDGTGFILGLAICAIGYDVAGYFIGTQFGRSRMSPRLSPNKTWEGLLGGMIASLVLGGIVGKVLAPWNGKISHGLALGVIVAIVAPIGDLCESMIKRDLGLKDLGSILPGHGGVLDRFDAMLFCLPAVYYLAIQLNIG